MAKSKGVLGSLLLSLIELLLLLLLIRIDLSLGDLRSGAIDVGKLKDDGLLLQASNKVPGRELLLVMNHVEGLSGGKRSGVDRCTSAP